MANFCENCQNHGRDVSIKILAQGRSVKVCTVYKTQHLALTRDDRHYMQCHFCVCKFVNKISVYS